jgi:hypothetical protein
MGNEPCEQVTRRAKLWRALSGNVGRIHEGREHEGHVGGLRRETPHEVLPLFCPSSCPDSRSYSVQTTQTAVAIVLISRDRVWTLWILNAPFSSSIPNRFGPDCLRGAPR